MSFGAPGRFWAGLLAVATVGCAHAGPVALPTKSATAPSPKTPTPAPPVTPARWSLHPGVATLRLTARLELGDGRVVWAGRSGERWLEGASGEAPTSASQLLPEGIAAIGRDGARVVFFGESGTAFVVDEPLGPVVATRAVLAPLAPLHAIAAGKSAVIALAADHAIVRTLDAGATWQKVGTPPLDAIAMQAAMLPSGVGAVLLGPQRVLVTVDDGATFSLVATPGIGGRRLAADLNGEIILEGVESSAILRTGPTRFEVIQRSAARSLELLGGEHGPKLYYAGAAAAGRGLFVGSRWEELVGLDTSPDDATKRQWSLARAELGGAPKLTPVRELDGCEIALLASNGATRIVACFADAAPNDANGGKKLQPKQMPHLDLFRSDDDGKSWRDDGKVPVDAAHPRIFLAPSGLLLVSGGCKASKTPWACLDSGPLVRLAGSKDYAQCTHERGGRFEHVVFDEPRGRVYAIGSGASGVANALYVSTDGGKDFTLHRLPGLRDGDTLLLPYGRSTSIDVDGSSVLVGIDMTSGFGYRSAVFRTDDDGASLVGKLAPREAKVATVGGKHAMAYAVDGKGWESADGGATWSAFQAPEASSARLACGVYGCVVDDVATRIGWDDAPKVEPPVIPTKVAALSALDCHPDGASTSLGRVDLPDLSDVDLGGRALFLKPRRDPDGSAVAVVGERSKAGWVLREHRLFGPAPVDSATEISEQLEGVIALRYKFRRDPATGASSKYARITVDQLVDVEVAWYRASTNKVSHATIKGVGPLEPDVDVREGYGNPSIARTALLSMSMAGAHVRPFASAKPGDPLFYVSDGGKIDRMTFPVFPKVDVAGYAVPAHVDGVRVGDRSVLFVVDVTGGQQVMAWSNTKGGWEYRTWAYWPEHDRGLLWLRNLDSGPTPGWVAHYLDGAGMTGLYTPLASPTAEPPSAQRVPGSQDLGDLPPPCAKGLADATRLHVPVAAGEHHPVFVDGDGLHEVLATEDSIVRFKGAKDWCVSTIEAAPAAALAIEGKPAPAAAVQLFAVVPPDDLAHAALFRSQAGVVSARPMSCVWTKGKLPENAAELEAFVVP